MTTSGQGMFILSRPFRSSLVGTRIGSLQKFDFWVGRTRNKATLSNPSFTLSIFRAACISWSWGKALLGFSCRSVCGCSAVLFAKACSTPGLWSTSGLAGSIDTPDFKWDNVYRSALGLESFSSMGFGGLLQNRSRILQNLTSSDLFRDIMPCPISFIEDDHVLVLTVSEDWLLIDVFENIATRIPREQFRAGSMVLWASQIWLSLLMVYNFWPNEWKQWWFWKRIYGIGTNRDERVRQETNMWTEIINFRWSEIRCFEASSYCSLFFRKRYKIRRRRLVLRTLPLRAVIMLLWKMKEVVLG